MILNLALVLYTSKKYGRGKPLKDYSSITLPEPPPWARDGIVYEIFVRAFSVESTFEGVHRKLDYLKELGVTILWFMPIFPVGKKGKKGTAGSPYAISDHRAVNPEYGTADDFRRLVEAIHQKGMKVILDFVPNHASLDNILLQECPDWFLKNSAGEFTRKNNDWTDVVDFDYRRDEVRSYFKETLLYWLQEFELDGFRCDVAGMVPYSFWEETIPALRKVNPDIFLLAEWEDPKILLSGFNSDYDWTFYDELIRVRAGRKEISEILDIVFERDSLYPGNALPLRFLENHDFPRAVKVFGEGAICAYLTLLFTLPGIPLIYAGQEMGDRGDDTLIRHNHYNIKWDEMDNKLLSHYRALISLRKKHSCFTKGVFRPVAVTQKTGSVGAFLRRDDHSAAFVICNIGKIPATDVEIKNKEKIADSVNNLVFTNVRNANFRIKLNNFNLEKIPPQTVEVFTVAEN